MGVPPRKAASGEGLLSFPTYYTGTSYPVARANIGLDLDRIISYLGERSREMGIFT